MAKLPKPLSFRPTEQAKENLENYKKEHNIKKDSKALNEILENSLKLQLEQTPNKDPNKPKLCPCETCKHFYEPNEETLKQQKEDFIEFVNR